MAMEDELCLDTPPAEWLEGYHAGRIAAAKDVENYILSPGGVWSAWRISLVASGDPLPKPYGHDYGDDSRPG